MASSSRDAAIHQHNISGLTVTGGRLFAGSNTTNNIFNGWYSLFQNIKLITQLMLHSGPVNLPYCATKITKCILVLEIAFILFSNL